MNKIIFIRQVDLFLFYSSQCSVCCRHKRCAQFECHFQLRDDTFIQHWLFFSLLFCVNLISGIVAWHDYSILAYDSFDQGVIEYSKVMKMTWERMDVIEMNVAPSSTPCALRTHNTLSFRVNGGDCVKRETVKFISITSTHSQVIFITFEYSSTALPLRFVISKMNEFWPQNWNLQLWCSIGD